MSETKLKPYHHVMCSDANCAGTCVSEPAPAAYCAHCEEHARMRQPTPAVEPIAFTPEWCMKAAASEGNSDPTTGKPTAERMTTAEEPVPMSDGEPCWYCMAHDGDGDRFDPRVHKGWLCEACDERRAARASEAALQAEVAALKVGRSAFEADNGSLKQELAEALKWSKFHDLQAQRLLMRAEKAEGASDLFQRRAIAAEADRDRLRAALEKTQTLLESAVGCLTAPRQEVGHALMDVLYVRKLVRAALSAPAENR